MTTVAQVLTVDDIVRSPALQLTVQAGATGLGRRVSWAHVSELEDPTPWLLGAELVMTTGIGIPSGAARQQAYLERLDDAGVSALAVSEELHVPRLSRAFVATADRRGLPILRVPLPVPFIAIAQEVAAAVHSDVYRRLTAQLHVFGALRTLASQDLSAAQLFEHLERLSGYRLFVSTAAGRELLPGVAPPPPDLVGLLPGSYSSAPVVPGGYVLPVPAPEGAAGYVLALERSGAVAAGLAVVQHIATVAALQLSLLRHEQETARREGAETLAELLQGVLDPAASRRRLERLGHPEGARLVLAVVRGSGDVDDGRIARALAEVDPAALLLRQHSDLVLLVADTTDPVVVLGGRDDLAVGVSRPFTAGEALAVRRREAGWAVRRAAARPGSVVRFGTDSAGRWLADDGDTLRELADSALGEVIAYDEQHGGALVPSVRTWLESDRQTAQAAANLHVHPNTLAYRVRRFEQLSGRSLQSTADLAEVWLALSAVPQVG